MYSTDMKFVRGSEYGSNLELIVIQDLKDIGIKVPKTKKPVEHDSSVSNQNSSHNAIFGNYLWNLPCEFLEGYGLVPKFLVDIVKLMEKSLDVEGIFRKSGSIARLKDIKSKLDAGEPFTDASVLDLAGLLKQFIRELPEPLLTTRLQESFGSCIDMTPPTRCLSAVLLLCHLLPEHHLSTLRYIASFLKKVTQQSTYNKMDGMNLAICLAPNIFRIGSSSAGDMGAVLAAQTNVVQMLIEHAGDIGVIPDDLHDRVTLMSECFSDCGADDGLEMTENREKRRSGSLQGLVSNLSNSFTKWRNKDKHNTSLSSTNLPVTCESSSASTVLDSNLFPGLTPVVIRKRKAEEESLPFSAGKRKAIIQNMPQMSVLSTTPFAAGCRKGKTESDVTLNTIMLPAHHPDTNILPDGDKMKNASSLNGKMRRGNSVDSSPCFANQPAKNKVRKSFEGLIRRLSGSKDSSSRDKTDITCDRTCDGDLSVLPQRSPSAPTFFSPLHDDNDHFLPIRQSLHTSFDFQSANNEFRDDICVEGRRRHRSLSSDGTVVNIGLRRGRPNTVRSGLPSPVRRQPSDVKTLSPETLAHHDGGSRKVEHDSRMGDVIIDTSEVIFSTGSEECLESIAGSDEGQCQTPIKICQGNDENMSPENDIVEDVLDQAFIGSIMETESVMTVDSVSVAEAEHQLKDALSDVECLPRDCNPPNAALVSLKPMDRTSNLHVASLDARRNHLERFVSLPSRSSSHISLTVSANICSTSSSSLPKIKPALFTDTLNKRFCLKTSSPCSLKTSQHDSPVCVNGRKAPVFRRIENN